MPLNYDKLSQVTDELSFGRKAKATAEGLRVVDSESPLNAMTSKPISDIVLGDNEIRRIVDSDFKGTNFTSEIKQKIKDAYKALKPQVIILDSAQVKKIMTSPQSEQRQFMSRLSDSERRRVLTMWKRIKDEDSAETPVQETEVKITETPVEPVSDTVMLLMFDSAISNTYINPAYNGYLKELIDTQITKVPEIVQLVANKVYNGVEVSQEEADAYRLVMTENELPSTFNDYYDIIETKDVDLDTDAEIQTVAEDDAEIATDRSFPTLSDASIKKFVSRGYDYNKVRDSYMAHFTMAYRSRISDSTTADVLSKIKIADLSVRQALESVEPAEETKPTIIELVESALQQFVNGSPEALQNLAECTVDDLQAQVAGEELPKETTETEVKETEPGQETEVKKITETSEHTEPKDNTIEVLQDIISLAQSILERHQNSSLVDSLLSKGHTYLNKYAVRISDSDQFVQNVDEGTVIDPEMSIEDYYGIAPMVPCAFGPVAHAMYGKECLPVDSWEQTGNCITVNGCQKYFPCYPINEIVAQLSEPNANLQKIIGATCITMDDALRAAAATNNLSVIDNRFYHKTHRDPAWYFDECPECLKGCCEGPHSVQFKHTLADCGDTVDIYGTPYILK